MSRTFAWMMAGVGLLVLGCSGSERTLVPVTGTVTYNGALVEGALVTFAGAGVTAFDTTDAEGKFSLNTRAGDGVEPGTYVVTVRKTTQAAARETPEDPMDVVKPPAAGGDEGMDAMLSMVTAPAEDTLLPAVYATLIQTPLRDYKVTAEGPNEFPIVLADDAVPAAELPPDQRAEPAVGE